jgi:hypothetical protein
MKIRSLLASLVIGAGLTASGLFANSVTINPTGYNGGDNSGGEFQATTSDNGSFVTFCVEDAVVVHYGWTYSYTLDGPNILLSGSKLTEGTAWLYEAFRAGTLVDGSTNGGGNYLDHHNVNAGLLQQAIWILQGDISGSNYYTNLVGNNKSAYTGTKVEVMNLWGADHQDVQSQLFLVPDGGATTALLGLGLLSLALFRRKL